MAKIKKGDLVQVITGAKQDRGGDRGKQGKVLEVIDGGQRVVVEGVNYITKHNRIGQTQRGTKTGGIETYEAPIHISNVALVDPDSKKPTRVGFRVEEQVKDGVKKTVRVRVAKKSGKDI
ncbi:MULTISPECIES: 50S ribosomal protein L24 [Microbacterium]|jgi:large subunit ribosomal protein L24|uniref:Large ribosomal subunit protein uL24 n=1 Tax=Microbacterium paludicola TaxID=300019 RepID=A0A4Y9FU27_9MICO|nr:50S ribosomal protein L24 [Microbacterium paludicola]MBF0816824.1 50S ribosomal protein L24 [Microbacterium paludicola]TFU32504.1 50S ribosomal protein L24 [Microbacterium paludicola]